MIILLNYFSLHHRSRLINHKVSVMPRINFGRILIIAQPDCCRVWKQGGLVIINIILKIFQKSKVNMNLSADGEQNQEHRMRETADCTAGCESSGQFANNYKVHEIN